MIWFSFSRWLRALRILWSDELDNRMQVSRAINLCDGGMNWIPHLAYFLLNRAHLRMGRIMATFLPYSRGMSRTRSGPFRLHSHRVFQRTCWSPLPVSFSSPRSSSHHLPRNILDFKLPLSARFSHRPLPSPHDMSRCYAMK